MTDFFELAKTICVPDRRIEKDDEILRGLRTATDEQDKDRGMEAPAVRVEEKP